MKKFSLIFKSNKGQTLVMLLVFMTISITVTTAAVALIINSSRATDKLYQGSNALTIAESGAETAIIKLLRNTSYTGETLDVGDGEAVVTVDHTEPITITSVGTLNNFSRTIEVLVSTQSGGLTVTSWREI